MLTLGALLAALAMVVLLFGERGYAQRIYPNISVRGVMVGGMHWTAARRAIEQQYAAFLEKPITIRYAEQIWQPSAADLGLHLEIDQALEAALAVGRSDVRAENVRITAAVWEQGLELPLHMRVDQRVMQRYLMDLAAQVEHAPLNADVALDGATIRVVAEAWGVQVLVDEMLTEMTAAAQSMTPQVVELRTRSLEPRVRDTDLAASEAYLRTLLAGPIRLRSPSSRCSPTCAWEWPVAQLASWLSLRPTTSEAGRPSIQVSIDQAAIRQALRPIAEALREEGTLPRVDWNGGELRITTPGDAGRGLDAAAALVQINAALAGGERDLLLPLIPLPPPVNPSNLNSLGITTRLGLGVSSFAKSEAYRITNIRAGARRMHGILIPPGATFSFNQNLGPVTATQGFVEGYAIIDNRTQKEWGGGLCQVSTTVFRAAFWSGLPITERHEHSFRIGWYEELGEPPGLDAAIFTGVYDLRFTNDTGGWLLMQSSVDLRRQRLSVALYGSPTGRTVRMDYRILKRTPAPTEPVYVDDPEQPVGSVRQSDTARGGLEVEVYRWVYQEDQLLARNTFGTTFKPWPDIFVRGTRPIQ
ncbi:VanW family protein [Oscillochloris trichoides DG-6]|uniref:VanW family protein n=1 Tax=Oscillochloris trichoides DG-6 TaxID=765420 RepID=E1IH50_9CHLR|nr:VanW family protein [Oscillochloris trichoides]EFO79525.1 VanW family protein [Oscillochloris trichoides DG-6]